jgi:phage replication O-like protein O
MAKPSLKNGYIQIASELAEQFSKASITGMEWRVLWVVLRQTWGWVDPTNPKKKKEWDAISLTQFEEKMGTKRANISGSISSLVAKRLLERKRGRTNLYRINADYEQWVVPKRLPHQITAFASSQMDSSLVVNGLPEGVVNGLHTIERTKETSTIEINSAPRGGAREIVQLIDSFLPANPMAARWYANKTERAALERLVGMYGFEQVKQVVDMLPDTNQRQFFPRITSPWELEKKWADLGLAIYHENNKAEKSGITDLSQ